MKSAKLFLGGMYLHLALSVAVPAAMILLPHWNGGQGLFFFYLVFIGVLFVLGWVAVAMAARAGSGQDVQGLWSAWRLLKLWSIPFFVLNFLYSVLAWFIIVAASRGIFFMLLPIPIAITCTLILQTGCVGCVAVKTFRSRSSLERRPDRVHYLLQLLPVADVISTLVLLRRTKEEEPSSP